MTAIFYEEVKLPHIFGEIFMKIVVDKELWTGSGLCVRACPVGAISLQDGMAVIDHEQCDLDGICIPACPHGAISLEE